MIEMKRKSSKNSTHTFEYVDIGRYLHSFDEKLKYIQPLWKNFDNSTPGMCARLFIQAKRLLNAQLAVWNLMFMFQIHELT